MLILEDKKGNKKLVNDFEFCLSERVDIPSPKKKIETYEVDGRDGSLTSFHGYQDIDIVANFSIMDKNFRKLFREFKKALNNTARISFTEDSEYFYKVKYVDFDNTENEVEELGIFSVSFRCEPFLYKYSGTEFVEYKTNSAFYNSGYKTYPIIKLTCSSVCEISINGQHIKFNGVTSPVIIDCERLVTYHEGVNQLDKMQGDFIELVEGENIIKLISGINKFEMKSNERWL